MTSLSHVVVLGILFFVVLVDFIPAAFALGALAWCFERARARWKLYTRRALAVVGLVCQRGKLKLSSYVHPSCALQPTAFALSKNPGTQHRDEK